MHFRCEIERPWRTTIQLLFFSSLMAQGQVSINPARGPGIVSGHTLVMKRPPQHVPSGTVVDGPILGNGDLGVAMGGQPEEQRFYFGKNDFWSRQASPMSVGGLLLTIPSLAGGSYQQEQDLAKAEVRGTFAKNGVTLKARSWTPATENLLVTELSVEGGASISATVKLFPEPTAIRDDNKPINLGREQHENGRWYFNGLIDEVHLFNRGLSPKEIKALDEMQALPDGLIRHWGFEADQGTNPIEAPIKYVLGPPCAGPPTVFRPAERPTDQPTGCKPDGYHLDYQPYGLGRVGRAIKLTHEWNYVDAGQAPALTQVTVAAWIYVFSAGQANYILSKGDWNDAYSLSLDAGRLRFNVGERFVRSSRALPDHQWVHVAGTFDGQVLRAYIDGEEVLPRARFNYGGASSGLLWMTRNADGPLDEQFPWPNPIAPTSSIGTKGREVAVATRVLGTEAATSENALHFELKPGSKVYLLTSVLSDLDAPQTVASAKARVSEFTPAELDRLNAAQRRWWEHFWSESFVDIGDPILEQFYYSSQYVIASASRTGKVAPGLYGNWVTTDHPSWNGDYTLNYNHETPFQALYSSNHVAISDSYDTPVLDFLGRAKIYARTILNVRGAYYPGHLGPWGLERPFDYDPFMGQKSDAAYLAAPMMMRFYSTWDRDYADKIYPFLLEAGNFWEDYLKLDDGRYVIYNDCPGEVGPWLSQSNWTKCAEDVNPINSLAYIRVLFKGLIDVSTELEVDASRRDKWKYMLDHLSALPTEERNGKIVFREAEKGSEGSHHAARVLWPSGLIGRDSDPALLTIARNTMMEGGFSPQPLYAPAAVRAGCDPKWVLDNLRALCLKNGYPNGYLFFPGGGVETASTVPGAINEMLLQSYEGVLRLFPAWPHEKNAAFGNLRAYGAFLVSSELADGEIRGLSIYSEKGKDCKLENPWPGKRVTLYRNRRKSESLSGPRMTFATSPGENISITSQSAQ